MNDQTQNQEDFDVEAWLSDAHLPEASETVYKRADLIGQIQHLERQISIETQASGGETVSGNPILSQLRKKRISLMESFARSATTLYLRALSRETVREIAQRHEIKPDDTPEARQEKTIQINRELLAASIVAIESPTLEKRDLQMDVSKVIVLEKAVGLAQMNKLMIARAAVQNEAPQVDADFLHGVSGTSHTKPEA